MEIWWLIWQRHVHLSAHGNRGVSLEKSDKVRLSEYNMAHQSSLSSFSVLSSRVGEDCSSPSSDFSTAFSFADDSFFWNFANKAKVKSSLEEPEDTPVQEV